ncbi:MAG: leucine-rich repeat domain-containing protein [Bacteroidaceae bacterium]|nr:leucine-rich repeat domain-containing protein [Bacteroidaceae bacterium]
MKRNLFLLLFLFLIRAQFGVNAQELTLSDIQSSGCLREVKASRNGLKQINDGYEENETPRTIILTKDGNVLTVQLLNYVSNCGTSGFDVTPYMTGGSNGIPCSLLFRVVPICEEDMDCVCPYNVSFTIHGLESNSFYFSCWWCEGQVNLKEGEPLVLKDSWENVSIGGLNYKIHKVMHSAKLKNGEMWEGALDIPSKLDYEGQEYIVTSIDYSAFDGNASLTSVIIPSSVVSIGSRAFSRCTSLTSVVIPESVKIIDYAAFKGCSNLSGITIPTSVIYIDSETFDGTAWYNNQPDGLVYAGKIAYKYKGTMYEGTKVTIKDGAYAIAHGAFRNCGGLASIAIPGSVTTIEDSAFEGCGSLTSVTIAEGLTRIENHSFKDCNNLESIDIPKSMTMIGEFAFQNCSSLSSIIIPEGVTRIGRNAFENCSAMTSVVISYGVKNIGYEVFSGCNSLTTVTIPGSVNGIGGALFFRCSNLTSVVISEGVMTIDWSAFHGCSNLTTITIPNSVIFINSFAFSECGNLTDVYCYADNVPRTEEEAFYGCLLTSVTLHVPAGSVDKYRTTSPWNGFGNIVALEETVSFTKDQMATIILPTEPDASKGKYYKLDKGEEGKIIFTEELEPKARTPYIIVPNQDFSIDLNKLDLGGLCNDTVSIEGISFIGSYGRGEISCQEGFYIDIIDLTPDCQMGDTNSRTAVIGALRACLIVNWDDPYSQGGTKGVTEKRKIVLHDNPNGIGEMKDESVKSEKYTDAIYDLSGRKINASLFTLRSSLRRKGIYIQNGKKVVVK